MKSKLSIISAITLFSFLIYSGSVTAQDKKPDSTVKKHIKIVTIKDGVKTETDTVISEGDVQVFDVGTDKKFRWVTAGSTGETDSISEGTEYRFTSGKGNKIIVMKRGEGKEPMIIREEETVGDSGKKVTVHVESAARGEGNHFYVREDNEGHSRILPFAPGARSMQILRGRGNVIDLSDPDVISFKKKKMSGDREKIVVIRKQAKEKEEATVIGYPDFQGEELKKMNEPRVVKELEIRKGELGHPIDRKAEIKAAPEKEQK